jgi:hypothetical protein
MGSCVLSRPHRSLEIHWASPNPGPTFRSCWMISEGAGVGPGLLPSRGGLPLTLVNCEDALIPLCASVL